MKNTTRIPALLLAASLIFGATAFAAEDHRDHEKKAPDKTAPASGSGELVKATEKDAEWVKKAKADYPLKACVVSGDSFDSDEMGPPVDYIYKQAGKPDRLVILCCKGCVKDFRKNPEKFLKKIDDAAAKKAKPVAPKAA